MKKVTIVVFGKTYLALSEATAHAADQLAAGTASESVTWADRSHVDYTVKDSSDEEFCEETNEDPEHEETT